MDSYFKKITIEIYYPDLDAGYDKKISSIHYQVTYPDMKGDLISRVQCIMNSGIADEDKNMQLAIWTASSKYTSMDFNFLKNDGTHADLVIRRTIYYKTGMPDQPVISQIIINTAPKDVSRFKISEQSPATYVHNKIAIAVAEMAGSAPSNFFRTVF
jgi:hypothetical protein